MNQTKQVMQLPGKIDTIMYQYTMDKECNARQQKKCHEQYKVDKVFFFHKELI